MFSYIPIMNQHQFLNVLFLMVIVLVYSCAENTEDGEELPIPTQYILTVTAGEGGTVTPEATGSYKEGTTVTLSATPNAGYEFLRWEGSDFDNSGCGFARYCRTAVTLYSNRDVQAFFEPSGE